MLERKMTVSHFLPPWTHCQKKVLYLLLAGATLSSVLWVCLVIVVTTKDRNKDSTRLQLLPLEIQKAKVQQSSPLTVDVHRTPVQLLLRSSSPTAKPFSPPVIGVEKYSTILKSGRSGTYPVIKEKVKFNCDNVYNRKFDAPFCLQDDKRRYFKTVSPRTTCYINATNFTQTLALLHMCSCLPNWHGEFCSVPEIVFSSDYPYEYGLAISTPPKRVIYAMPINQEFDLLQAKLFELADVVDVFIILESNYTASGTPKEWLLQDKLKKGYLKEFHHQILYLQLSYFPESAYTDGWVVDALLRNYIGEVGLSYYIKGMRETDIFVINDADEIPMKEAILFLKLHYGYPEPFGFNFRHNVFGFFWLGHDIISSLYGGCTVGMLNWVYKNQPYRLRNALRSRHAEGANLGEYERHSGKSSQQWTFGSKTLPAGWHCSWCAAPQLIRDKLLSAHMSDTPRWGSYPNKTHIGYIKSRIQSGYWFDDTTKFDPINSSDPFFAPKYVLRHQKDYAYLLQNTHAHNRSYI